MRGTMQAALALPELPCPGGARKRAAAVPLTSRCSGGMSVHVTNLRVAWVLIATTTRLRQADRKSDVEEKCVSVRVDLGGDSSIKKNKNITVTLYLSPTQLNHQRT